MSKVLRDAEFQICRIGAVGSSVGMKVEVSVDSGTKVVLEKSSVGDCVSTSVPFMLFPLLPLEAPLLLLPFESPFPSLA